MTKRKITEPALLQKENKKNTFQDRMDRLIGQSPSEERNDLRRQLQDEIFLKVIGNEKQKELESRLEKLSNRDFFRIENKEYKGNKFLDCRVYFLDKETQEYRPTKKGISFNHNVAKEVIEALLEEMETDNWNNFETN